jgi:hypothetical protein
MAGTGTPTPPEPPDTGGTPTPPEYYPFICVDQPYHFECFFASTPYGDATAVVMGVLFVLVLILAWRRR